MFTDDLAASTVMTALSGLINVMVRPRCGLFLRTVSYGSESISSDFPSVHPSRLILRSGRGSSDFDLNHFLELKGKSNRL